MCIPGVPFADDGPESYLPSSKVHAYIVDFVAKFNLSDCIKLRHQVLGVVPIVDSTRWSIKVRDILADAIATDEFDAVFVCNGHYTMPYTPDALPGSDQFEGVQLHSQAYRRAESLAGKSVLLIGSGLSAADIAMHVRNVAAKLCVSAHGEGASMIGHCFGDSVLRSDVQRLTRTGAVFADDMEEAFDVIMYCTGYLYDFPFIGSECGIDTADNHVRPLFKDFVHIERPTMFFVGLLSFGMSWTIMDIQAKAAMGLLIGTWTLPTKEEMYAHAEAELQLRFAKEFSKRRAHQLKELTEPYAVELLRMAKLGSFPPVFFKMFNHCIATFITKYAVFRNQRFRVLDEENFEIRYPDEAVPDEAEEKGRN